MSRNEAHMEELEAKVNEAVRDGRAAGGRECAAESRECAERAAWRPRLRPAARRRRRRCRRPWAGGGGQEGGAASLALMSALTFVALTGTPMGGLPTIASRHVPGARALMSLPEERSVGFGARAAPAVAPGNAAAAALLSAETAPLWPALHAAASAGAAASGPPSSPSPAPRHSPRCCRRQPIAPGRLAPARHLHLRC